EPGDGVGESRRVSVRRVASLSLVREDVGIAGDLEAALTAARLPAPQADVPRDLQEPRRLDPRDGASAESAERVEKRRLHRVLGLLARAEVVEAVRVDPALVSFVETLRLGCLGCDGHPRLFDTSWAVRPTPKGGFCRFAASFKGRRDLRWRSPKERKVGCPPMPQLDDRSASSSPTTTPSGPKASPC